MKIIIYVLCYNKDSYESAVNEYSNRDGFKILYIETTPLLENIMYDSWLLDHQDEWENYDYVGTISWKASQKCRIPDTSTLITYLQNNDIDIYTFYRLPCNLIEQATYGHPYSKYGHPKFENIWIKLFNQLNVPESHSTNPKIIPFFSNYWITRPKIMLKYIEFFKTVKHILDTCPDIQQELWEDAMYGGNSLCKEKCMELYGKPYYPYHVFIYERLPCYFFWSIGAKLC